jgi:CRISPR system Cascade subunit CasE
MYFSRITLNTKDAGHLARLMGQGGYRDHQCLWRLFPERPDAARDFIFRREQASGSLLFYLVSAMKPQNADDIWRIETKSYDPKIRVGQRFAFSLHANPVVTRWLESPKRQVRHDVVMDAKKKMGYANIPVDKRPHEFEIVQEAGVSWLQSRIENSGFSINADGVRVDAYQQHRFFKRGGQKPIQFSTLDFTGILQVDDPVLFHHALFNGIGRAKGLGCGLLLVRPIAS